MDIETIKTVLTVANCENFTEASHVLFCAPSVVSKRVTKIERELGVELFVRGKKSSRLVPTAACKAILPDFKAMMDCWRKAQGTAVLYAGERESDCLRIGAPARFWPSREDDLVAGFIAHFSDLNVLISKLSRREIVEKLIHGELDLAFLLFQKPLCETDVADRDVLLNHFDFFVIDEVSQMGLVVGEQFEEGRQEESTLDRFAEYAFAFNVNSGGEILSDHLDPFLELASAYGFRLHVRPINTRDRGTYLAARRQKIAVPQPVEMPDWDGLRFVRLLDWTSTLTTYCVIPKNRRNTLAARLAEFVRRCGYTPVSIRN